MKQTNVAVSKRRKEMEEALSVPAFSQNEEQRKTMNDDG
jgi:hypothetical protein